MADQVVGDLAEVLGGRDRGRQLIERLGVDDLDGVDEVVEADGVSDPGRLLHASTTG